MREARSGGKSDRTGRKGKPYGTSESLTRLRAFADHICVRSVPEVSPTAPGAMGKPYGTSESFASASGKKIEKVCQMQKRAGFPRVSYWEGN